MKIDVSEVRVQKELLVISVNSIKEQLSVSRSRLSEVVSTDSLKGTVKDAINQKVTNYQIPLVDNYVNALDFKTWCQRLTTVPLLRRNT